MHVTVIDNFDSLRSISSTISAAWVPGEGIATCSGGDRGVVTARSLVLSPGPSTPANAGNLMAYIDHFHRSRAILACASGTRASSNILVGRCASPPRPYHGKQSLIEHGGDGIYRDLPSPLPVGRYH